MKSYSKEKIDEKKNAGGFIKQDCWAHVLVTEVQEFPQKKQSGDPIIIKTSVLRACDLKFNEIPSLKGKTFDIRLRRAEGRDTEAQAERKEMIQYQFLSVCGLAPDVPDGQEFDPKWDDANQKQLVLKIEEGSKKKVDENGNEVMNGDKNVWIPNGYWDVGDRGFGMYRLDDADARQVPKDERYLKYYKAGGDAPAESSGSQEPVGAAAAEDDDISTL